MLSQKEGEEVVPLFEHQHLETDYELDLSPDEHVGVDLACSHSMDATQFHDLVDCMESTLNLSVTLVHFGWLTTAD